MLFRRLTGEGDMLEYKDFVKKLMRPILNRERKELEEGLHTRPIIRGEKLKAIRDLFRTALEM